MHRNSHDNKDPHHLYEIFDKQEKEVFKYGISSDPIEEDGMSRRTRRQLKYLNLAAGWIRYFVRILITGISGRQRAEEIEDEHIEAFEKKHGKMPRGNLRKNRKNR
ncbi:MAG: hypothetical protein H6563_13510 [Lewinellaceae bacterium]|nr:hypothetical protein [Lewinellaceae bacterium]